MNMKQHIIALATLTVLATSCMQEELPTGTENGTRVPLGIGMLSVSNGIPSHAASRGTSPLNGTFAWATNDLVRITATPIENIAPEGAKTYTTTYIYQIPAGQLTGVWIPATGKGYEDNTPIYLEDIDTQTDDGLPTYSYTAQAWGGASQPTGNNEVDGTAILSTDQSTAAGYIASDYIYGPATLVLTENGAVGTITADGQTTLNDAGDKNILVHRTVDVAITLKRGNGWGDTDTPEKEVAANAAFVKHLKQINTAKGFKIYTGDDYNVLPILITDADNDGKDDTDAEGKAIVTLRAHIPAASLPGDPAGAKDVPLFSLVPPTATGQTTPAVITSNYTRPADVVDGKCLTVSLTYSHILGLSDAQATVGEWIPVGNLPGTDGGFQTTGYDLVILKPEHLARFAAAVNAGAKITSEDTGLEINATEASVLQLVDIDLSRLPAATSSEYTATADNWTPIGTIIHPFQGYYNGHGRSITGLKITQLAEGSNAGLFGNVSSKGESYAALKDIHVIKADITLSTTQDAIEAGILVGYSGTTLVNRCSATGSIDINTPHTILVGGLVGVSEQPASLSFLTNCHAEVEIKAQTTATDDTKYIKAGGLVGYNNNHIVSCSATGTQVTVEGIKACAGGLVGESGTKAGIYLSFSFQNASATHTTATTYVGGLTGFNQGIIACSYATGKAEASTNSESEPIGAGAICGYNADTDNISSCFGTGSTETIRNGTADDRKDGKGTSNLSASDMVIYTDGSPAGGVIYNLVAPDLSIDGVVVPFTRVAWNMRRAWNYNPADPYPSINQAYNGN